MAEIILNTIFQVRRGLAETWEKNNPVLKPGEPGFELDTGKLKFGDGVSNWKTLPYINENNNFDITVLDSDSIDIEADRIEISGFKNASPNQIPQKTEDGTIQWIDFCDSASNVVLQNQVEVLDKTVQKQKYNIVGLPSNVLVDYRDKEIRIMYPYNTNWASLTTEDFYYINVRAYAPSNDIVAFKLNQVNDLAAVDYSGNLLTDEYGRKYCEILIPVAFYRELTDTWDYVGKDSTENNLQGFNYYIGWYTMESQTIESIRINLSNEESHGSIEDYYMGQYQKNDDLISMDRLTSGQNTVFVFNGGSAAITGEQYE